MSSTSFLLVGPMLDPPEARGLQGKLEVADGLNQNKAGSMTGWHISSEATTLLSHS